MEQAIIDKEAARVDSHNERAKQLGLPATLTLNEWLNTLEHFQWTCAYCSGTYEVLEHFIPLALQGETSAQNCLPSCFLCNARKGDTHPGALSWIAPATLLYIRSYFASLHTGTTIAPLTRATATAEERPDAIYTLKDVATKLKVSEPTIRRYIRNGKIQAVLIHGKWMFSEDDIIQLSVTSQYTLQEVTKLFNVCEKTIYRWVDSGQVKALQLGRRLLFSETEVKRFMDLRRRARVRQYRKEV